MLINTLRYSCGEAHSQSSAEKCQGGIGRSSAPDCRVLSDLQFEWEKQCWAVLHPSPPPPKGMKAGALHPSAVLSQTRC